VSILNGFSKDVEQRLWIELAIRGRFDLLEVLSQVEKGEVKKLRVKRKLVDDLILHNTVIKYLEKHGVTVVREDIVKG